MQMNIFSLKGVFGLLNYSYSEIRVKPEISNYLNDNQSSAKIL